jgi:excisionase family DNA binding protein
VNQDGELLTAEETAQVLVCSIRTVRGLIHRGELRGCVKIGNGYRIPARAIEEATGGTVRVSRGRCRDLAATV